MNAEPEHLETVFAEAIQQRSAEERAAYLELACAGQSELRKRVEALLQAHDAAAGFLQPAPPLEAVTVEMPPIAERPGTIIGPYELMEQIGEGGFGLVFVAEQREPVRRKVALKIIKPGMDSGEVIARFEAERQALAIMEHPNIARIFDGGTTQSGRPYFVMELVKGIPIIEYCDQQQLTARQRLDLFLTVCQAVQHAHGKGIIHRDLKPSNILVAPHDGVPVVKVIDFGVAKAIGQQLTTKKIYTRFTQMIGTPLYMSPEQAEINALDIDIRSDVYSLGVLLYELLTGTTPFDKQRFATAAYDEIRRIIKEEEPPKPSTRLSTLGATLSKVSAQRKTEPAKLSALVCGDLDWIVMKALEKERTRRYDTASAMAADVRRFLGEEPVEARPPSTWYRFRKMARRNRAAVMTVALVAATLLLGFVVSAWQAVCATRAEAIAVAARDDTQKALQGEAEQRAVAVANAHDAKDKAALASKQEQVAVAQAKIAGEERQRALFETAQAELARQKAEASETKAEWRLYASNIASAQVQWESKNAPLAYHYLNQTRPDFRGWEHNFLYTLFSTNQETILGHTKEVQGVAFSPDGKRLASASFDQTVKVWDVATGQETLILRGHTSQVRGVAFSPDGKRLASAGSQDKTVKVWDAATGQETLSLKGHTAYVSGVAFSPDGKRLASTSADQTVKVWDAATGQETFTLKGHQGTVSSVVFSPDGKSLASAGWDATVKVWDATTGQETLTLRGHTSAVYGVAFSPDGKRLASASADQTAKVWDAATGQETLTLRGHTAKATSVAFSPDGKRLASASGDQTVKVWDAFTGQVTFILRGHTANVDRVVFSPDGKRLASASYDKTVKLWDLARTQGVLTFKGNSFAFSPDGNRLATSAGLDVKSWDLANGREFGELRTLIELLPRPRKGEKDGGTLFALSPDGMHMARLAGGTLKLWDAGSGKGVRTLMEVTPKEHNTLCMAFSADGKRLAAVIVVHVPFENPADRRASYTVKVWDTASGKEICTVQGPVLDDSFNKGATFGGGSGETSVAFSPDGKRLTMVAGYRYWAKGEVPDFTQQVWDADAGQEVLTLKGHKSPVYTVAFSPDGKRLATATLAQSFRLPPNGSPDGERPATTTPTEVKLWDTASGQEVLTLKGTKDNALGDYRSMTVVFSPDGKRLATALQDQTVTVWDAASGKEILTLKGHTGGVLSVAFSPDGKRLVTASNDKTLKLWDAVSGQEVLTLRGHTGPVASVVFSANGKRLASAGGGTIMIWDASKSMTEAGQK